MEQKKKFSSQIEELEHLLEQCGSALKTAATLDIGVPLERQECRDKMRVLRELLGDMKLMSIQVEMYLAEYSNLTEASNDSR